MMVKLHFNDRGRRGDNDIWTFFGDPRLDISNPIFTVKAPPPEEMKKQDNEQGATINNKHISALAIQDKNKREHQASLALQKQMYPRTSTRGGFGRISGSAAQAGVNAGSNVGLNRQVSGRAAYRLGGS